MEPGKYFKAARFQLHKSLLAGTNVGRAGRLLIHPVSSFGEIFASPLKQPLKSVLFFLNSFTSLQLLLENIFLLSGDGLHQFYQP
jgi:hypothetical protein